MWLINTKTYRLEHFVGNVIPDYAILSHTWGNETDEVTFQEWQSPTSSSRKKKGFVKIMFACARACEDGIEYLWADTNCIDKSSSAELSEAINSMFSWYRKAEICYVYLVDVEDPCDIAQVFLERDEELGGDGFHKNAEELELDRGMFESATEHAVAKFKKLFCKSRWFSRGWTLQELLAPSDIRFYTRDWKPIGRSDQAWWRIPGSRLKNTRSQNKPLLQLVSKITGIRTKVLLEPENMDFCSVGEKMSWMAQRSTSREEDMAYCMMGIFNINMPLVYGEGRKAFQRLQQEIIGCSVDHSIFAWQYHHSSFPRSIQQGFLPNLFAVSPKQFSNFKTCSGDPSTLLNTNASPMDAVISLNNVGVSLNLELISTGNPNFFLAALNLVSGQNNASCAADRDIWCIGLQRLGNFYFRTKFPQAPIRVRVRRPSPLQQICVPRITNRDNNSRWKPHDYVFLILFPDSPLGIECSIKKYTLFGSLICHKAFGTICVEEKTLNEEEQLFAVLKIARKGTCEIQLYIGIRKTTKDIETAIKLYEPTVSWDSIHSSQPEFRPSAICDDKLDSWSVVVGKGQTTQALPYDSDLDPPWMYQATSKRQTVFSITLFYEKNLAAKLLDLPSDLADGGLDSGIEIGTDTN